MPTRIAALLSLLFGANGLALAAGGAINGGGPASSLGATVACTNGSSANINSGNLYIDCTNTRVGINTASPGALLDIGAGDVGTTPKNVLLSDRTDTSVGGGVMFRTLTAVRFGGVNDDSGSESFQLRNNSNVVQMYLGIIGARAGRLGLGTSSPATLFHMSSGTITVDGNTTSELNLGGQPAITNAVVQVTTGTTGPATLSVFNNGSVVVGGRTTPTAGTLTVAYGNSQNSVFWIGDNNNSAFGPRSLRMGNTQAAGGGLMEEQTYNGNSNNEPLVLQRLGGGVVIGGVTGNATLSVVAGSMTISGASAALGLNTTTPATLFHMSSGTLTIDGNTATALIVNPTASNPATATAVVVGSMTVTSGAFTMSIKTKAQLDVITPALGNAYICSDCSVTYAICTATGTTLSGFRRADSSTAGCGSGN